MTGARQSLGRRGEQLAAGHLQSLGYSIVQYNYRCPAGEVDLIAWKGDALVFVEVKARRSRRFGLPEEALTPRKQAHLLAAAQTYLQENHLEDAKWRVDVIAIELDSSGNVRRLRHIENAVTFS